MLKSGLYIISTPIGNLGDITSRSCDVLKSADIIACEDTRVSKKLLGLLGLFGTQTLIPCHEHNVETASDKIVDFVKQGKVVALISDAGSPIISDPGALVIKKMIAEGLYYTALPGATAFVPALQMSGIMTDRFMFCGFLPNKTNARVKYLKEIENYDTALIFYETPHRLIDALNDFETVFSDTRKCAVVREISKIYEEIVTDSFEKAIEHFSSKPTIKGEFVIVVSKPEKKELSLADFDLEKMLKVEMQTKSLKEAVATVSMNTGIKKKIVYSTALKINDG